MSQLYILRGILPRQAAHEADIGMKNIQGMGKYANAKNAQRYLVTAYRRKRAAKEGYTKLGLYDDKGIILTIDL